VIEEGGAGRRFYRISSLVNLVRRALMKRPPHPAFTRAMIIVTLLVIWEIAARWLIDPMFVSPPSSIILTLGTLFSTKGVLAALLVMLSEMALAFVLSVVIGGAIGMLIGASGLSRRSAMPIILLLYATPQIALLPIVILAAGIGPTSKVLFGVSHGIFPMILTVEASMRNMPPVLKTAMRSLGASRWHQWRYLWLPYMMPGLFTGMRLAMSATLLGVLLAELFASSNGVGHFARRFAETFDPASLFGLIGVVATMAIVFNETLRRAEMRLSRWRVR